MVRNLGKLERAIRAGLGLYLMRSYRKPRDFANWRSALGGFWLLTAAAGYCPVYQAFGISTRKGVPMRPHLPDVNLRRLAFWR